MKLGDIAKISLDHDTHSFTNRYANIYSGMSSGKYGLIRSIDEEFYQIEYWDCTHKRKDWYLLNEFVLLEKHDFIYYSFTYRQDEFTKSFDHFSNLHELSIAQHKMLDDFLGITFD